MRNKYDISEVRKNELSELAEFIADEYFPDSMICPYKIAESYGIKYTFNDYGDAFDGLLEHKNGRFHIFINSKKAKHKLEPRVRFTMAHELGHYIIDEHRNALKSGLTPSHPSFTNFSSDNEVELEADFFASSLLIPKSRLIKDVFKKKFNYNLIAELSSKYQTSITATLLKFISIGNHPVMIICTIDSKIKWYKHSDDFPFKYINALPGFKVPANTSVGQYFYENGTKNENSEEIVFAQDWFSINFKSDYNRQFKEYCIYSDANKFVMSVLWES